MGGRYLKMPKILRNAPYPIFLSTLQTIKINHKKTLSDLAPLYEGTPWLDSILLFRRRCVLEKQHKYLSLWTPSGKTDTATPYFFLLNRMLEQYSLLLNNKNLVNSRSVFHNSSKCIQILTFSYLVNDNDAKNLTFFTAL